MSTELTYRNNNTMNAFSLSEIQLATVTVAPSATGRPWCHGLVVSIDGTTAVLLPGGALPSRRSSAFVRGRDASAGCVTVEASMDASQQAARGALRADQVVAIPLESQSVGAMFALELDLEATSDVDDDELTVLPMRTDRIFELEHAWLLRSALSGDIGLPVFEPVPGRDQYACLAGMVVGPATMVTVDELVRVVRAATSSRSEAQCSRV